MLTRSFKDLSGSVKPTRTCAVCLRPLAGLRSDARYCSDACRQRGRTPPI
jgi:predicted nucleic acid-binding Zn ribbon protein